ncbi:MAG: hypothetical protein QOD56_1893 [Gammaproteobacteria bacterium]|nr:hypothetical protein [Gammaproteobacteria bacterium]
MLPPTALAAHRQAAYIAASFKRRLSGRSIRPLRFGPRGTLVSLGAGEAAGDFPGLRRGATGFSTRGGAANPVKMFHDGASSRGRMIEPKL